VNHVAALLLAAGRSRRMGAFKPLLPFGDVTVIETCINNLRGAEVNEIIVVVGHRANEIQKHLESYELRFALNPDSESEMGESIRRGVERISGEAKCLLIALADHPAVSGATIEEIVAAWQHGARLVQPEHAGRGGHPVLIDLSYRDELLNLDTRTGLRSFFDAHRTEVLRLPVESPYVARDMDTWEDYLALYHEVLGREPATNSGRFS
jgi:molybdenum cofactor cytidylyltransferase